MNVTGISAAMFQQQSQVGLNSKSAAVAVTKHKMGQTNMLSSVPTNMALAQMPNVSFGNKYGYGHDDLSAYDAYSGPQPPAIEKEKFGILKQVSSAIEQEDYLAAIKGKIKLAQICKSQAKESDAFMLEEGVRRLYKDLPKYLKEEAKSVIAAYNKDMATYIEQDIKKLL